MKRTECVRLEKVSEGGEPFWLKDGRDQLYVNILERYPF